MATKGDVMGKHARISLLLGASACLLAAMVDWVIDELNELGTPSAGKLASPPTPVPGRSHPLRGRALAWRSRMTKDAILLTGPLGLGHELELGRAAGAEG
jgi:hypothetical protein